MTDLVERYVHQVGRHLPPKERADIEAELRSMIQDQLDDRYGGEPSPADVAAVLAELGHPYQIATSYRSEQYLIGPDVYPYMLMVLRYGWLLVPAIMLFLSSFGVLISGQPITVANLVIEPLFAALQATFVFSGAVVLIFALIERLATKSAAKEITFNPADLPEVDDPGMVDRFGITFGMALALLVILLYLFWLRVGGLTLRFDLSDPGQVIPVSSAWLIVLIVDALAMVVLHLRVLWRNRWGVGLWLIQTVLEILGVIGLYFVLYEPIFTHLILPNPSLAAIPFIDQGAKIIAVISAVGTLVSKGSNLVRLWSSRSSHVSPFAVQTNNQIGDKA